MSNAYCRVSCGKMFDICDAWWKKDQAAHEAINALCLEVGATPGRKLSCGSRLEGLYFTGIVTRLNALGWRSAGKKFPGYYKPDIRKATGRALESRLNAVTLPTDEELAHALGMPPFYTDETGDWCTSVGSFMRGGVFYLEFPAQLSYCFAKKVGVDLIAEWEYIKARDAT